METRLFTILSRYSPWLQLHQRILRYNRTVTTNHPYLNKTCQQLAPHINLLQDRNINPQHQTQRQFSSKNETIEKRLIKFMDMWEMEKAVKLMRESIQGGHIPNTTVVLNLLQQLANLGETECLLDLHEFLREKNLVSDTKFFKCLQEAYYNSGRVDEGVAVLRILYHRTRKYREVESLFCLLAVMVMRHFPDRIEVVEGFVIDLKEFANPVVEPMASLWKCYLLTESFETAEKYYEENEEIRAFVPQMVNDICAKINKIDANYDKVFEYLLAAPFIKNKQKVLVYESLAETLCDAGQYDRAVHSLMTAKTEDIPLHPARVQQIVAKIQQNSHGSLDDHISDLLEWCQKKNAKIQ